MGEHTIQATVFRFDPIRDKAPYYRTYEVPYQEGMSALDVLDYIYHNQDGTLAYYDHAACTLGVCGKCSGRINGRPGLFCQTRVEKDITLEPLDLNNVLKDLVVTGNKAVRNKEEY
ncbi:MAG: 2Fe-2S iron-sulfur cluster-binding protein [Desulfobacterales bacterium]